MKDHIYSAAVAWARGDQDFSSNRYSRVHTWRFDGDIEVRASSSPQVVPLPMSAEDAVDPEEAFVAALSSCHMLWFLGIAAKRGYVVDGYRDDAEGVMARTATGKMAMTRVKLQPHATFGAGRQPDATQLEALHHEAHENCFIANSVRTEIICEPTMEESRAA